MSQKTAKVIKTPFGDYIYHIVNNKAKEIFQSGLFELYALYPDDSEALVETFEDLNEHLERGYNIGIAVGYSNFNQN